MKKIDLLTATAFVAFLGIGTTFAANPMVGGDAMSDVKNIVQNAMNSKDHTTLVTAVKAGGLVDTLEGKDPFTVFAPTNRSFCCAASGNGGQLIKAREQKGAR